MRSPRPQCWKAGDSPLDVYPVLILIGGRTVLAIVPLLLVVLGISSGVHRVRVGNAAYEVFIRQYLAYASSLPRFRSFSGSNKDMVPSRERVQRTIWQNTTDGVRACCKRGSTGMPCRAIIAILIRFAMVAMASPPAKIGIMLSGMVNWIQNQVAATSVMACKHIQERVTSIIPAAVTLPSDFEINCSFAIIGNSASA
eukprot:1454326-Rhodomonas_salina.1